MNVTVSQINPFVRLARQNEKLFSDGIIYAYDHRLFYLESGEADLFICGKRINLVAGDAVYWHSGIGYRMVLGKGALLSGCNFDFLSDSTSYSAPIPPCIESDYNGKLIEDVSFTDFQQFNKFFVINNAFSVSDKMRELIDEFKMKRIYSQERCSALLKDILVVCMRLLGSNHNSKSSVVAEQILSFVRANYSDDLTNKRIAEHFHYHPNYVSSLILAHTGKTLHRYVTSYRIDVAIDLLQSTDHSVSDIAEMVGMGDIYHFSKVFKEMIGVSPGNFKRK